MIQSFSVLFKSIFNSRSINFRNPLSSAEFQILESYYLNHLADSSFHAHHDEICHSPHLRYIFSYNRNYITFLDNSIHESTVSIPVVYCESCNHYHALLPPAFISPCCQYSVPFILSVVCDKLYSSLTVDNLSSKYGISISTIYRWMERYSYVLKYYIQLRNRYTMNFFISLLYLYEDIISDIFDVCIKALFQYDRTLFHLSS